MNHVRRNEVCGALGFTPTRDLDKYSRVPFHHKRVNKETYYFIIDKVGSRLSNWKAISVSLDGLHTLIWFVVNAIPNYVIRSSLIPPNTCETIE